MRRTILFMILAALTTIFSLSCSSGVSQEQYQKVTDELAGAESQIQSLKTQLSDSQSQIETLQTQVTSLISQNQIFQSNLQFFNSKIGKAKTLADLVDKVMQTYLSPVNLTPGELADVYVRWSRGVEAVGDPLLSAKLASVINASTLEQQDKATDDFVSYLFTLQSKLLQSEEVNLGEKFYLSIGETVKIAGESLSLRFDDVTGDSRCPQDVVCIWEGLANCVLTIDDGLPTQVTLEVPGLSESSTYQFRQYRISYDLKPYPTAANPIQKQYYYLSMTVSIQ